MREVENWNSDWLFFPGDGSFAEPDADESGFVPVTLPHDWSADYAPDREEKSGDGGGFARTGTGWYRKHFTACLSEGTRTFAQFDGVYMNSTVYVNGTQAAEQGYGYSSFEAELTPYVRDGENVVAVRVDNSAQPNSRWYTGSGIYRDVRLIRTGSVRVAENGIRALTNGFYDDGRTARLQIRAMVENGSTGAVYLTLEYALMDRDGETVCTSGTGLKIAAGKTSDSMVCPVIRDPHPWTVKDPYLYTLRLTILKDGEEADRVETRIGIRTAEFDKNRGFLLNGVRVKIKGMCLHHDSGLFGAAFYPEVWRRRLLELKDMGCNGIRSAHNPPAPAFLDLCDELGFLVMDELYDEWMLTKNKTFNYYSQEMAHGASAFFSQDAEKELVRMLRRDFNHPSVILWSIGNEVPEQSAADGAGIAAYLTEICHREDVSRKVTSACDMVAAPGFMRTRPEFMEALDVVGYNYVDRWRERAELFYEPDRLEHPDWCFIGTEHQSVGLPRGDYEHEGRYTRMDYRTVNMAHELLWRYTASRDFVAGDYLWTGIDYLGESMWPYRGSDGAPIDTAGFKKDYFYYFRSIWNEEEETLHLLPHWNHSGREGEYLDVLCYTSCEEVKLYINGRYIGSGSTYCPRYGFEKGWGDNTRVKPTTNDLHLKFNVMYEPGELRAEGYRGGVIVAETTVRTSGPAVRLEASVFPAVPGEILQIELKAVDAEGRYVPDACPEIRAEVRGGELIGLDGGDLGDLTGYKEPQRAMVGGLLFAAVRPGEDKDLRIRFEADGLKPLELTAAEVR